MACQASARVARGWINSSGRLHGGRALVRDGRGKLLSFWECLCFIFSTITADSCMVACTDPVATDTIPSAPGREWGAKRFLMRGLLVGGPAVAGLGPLLFLSCRSGGRRGRKVQRYLGSGALALRRGVASGWAWTASWLLSPSRLRGENGRYRYYKWKYISRIGLFIRYNIYMFFSIRRSAACVMWYDPVNPNVLLFAAFWACKINTRKINVSIFNGS